MKVTIEFIYTDTFRKAMEHHVGIHLAGFSTYIQAWAVGVLEDAADAIINEHQNAGPSCKLPSGNELLQAGLIKLDEE